MLPPICQDGYYEKKKKTRTVRIWRKRNPGKPFGGKVKFVYPFWEIVWKLPKN